MAMEEGLDTGPVLLEQAIPIGLLENAKQLGERLAQLTAALLVEAMPRIESAGPGTETERLTRLGVRSQAGDGLTYARMLTKQDFQIDWSQSALAIHRRVMGLYPGATASWNGKRLKLLATEPLVERLKDQLSHKAAALVRPVGTQPEAEPTVAGTVLPGTVLPGTVLELVPEVGLVVASGGCPLLVREAQVEGKAAAVGTQLLQQLQVEPGDRLG
jgi:methionyl-tRNA formyltransferase